MSLQNRISRLERIYHAELNRRGDDRGRDHDSSTADHLLRILEGGADDWVCRRMENVIEHCQGITPDARTRLQQKLETLKTGSSDEILLVIGGLCRNTPEWVSARESSLVAASSKGSPAMAKAIAKYGIRFDGRRDWAGFAQWLEQRILRKNVSDSIPAEVLNQPGVMEVTFSPQAQDVISARECSTDFSFHTESSSTITDVTEDASP
jgi:hypothetical protein